MSKVSFRARALDSNKPLPLYTEDELPDLAEYVAINRTVPQMPTGMEKEEELERHLQRVINARQNFNEAGKSVVIPIPEATIPVPHYSSVYQSSSTVPYCYIRVPGLGLREDVPDYDLDSEDEEWLSAQSKERPLSPTHFERMMDKLEKGSGNTVLSEHDAQVLLKDEEDLVMAVYDYWLAKRLRLGHSLIPTVRNERRDGVSSSNPYLAFRKRTEKMQTRKNRKNDEQAYTHMLKLKRDLTKAMTLMELVRDREIKKNELDHCYADVFRKRYQLEDWSGSLISNLRPVATPSSGGRRLSTTDGHFDGKGLSLKIDNFDENRLLVSKKKKKKKFFSPIIVDNESPLTPSTLIDKGHNIKELDERNEISEPDGPFSFKRKVHVHYHANYDWSSRYGIGLQETDDDTIDCHIPKRFRYSQVLFNGRKPSCYRRRTGRGGRTIWDRSGCSDRLLENVDMDSVKQDTNECPCFCPVSPAPGSTNFEFSYLPFVDPATYYCPDLSKGYSKFGGLHSDSESQDKALSFSTLPTSLFALRPSSSDSKTQQSNVDGNSSGLTNPKNSSNMENVSLDKPVSERPDTLQVPPTHLSLVEIGLPVQIHVGNLKHLPKRDNQTPSGNQPPIPSSLSPSLAPQATMQKTTLTGTVQNISASEEPNWEILDPSSGVLSLDKPLQFSKMSLRFRRNFHVTSQTVSNITSQFKLTPKAESSMLHPPVLVPSSSTTSISVPSIINRTSLPITTLSSPLTLQSKLVALDQRNVEPLARDKNSTHLNNQKNSPNGSIHDLFHSKLPAEAEKDIKQALTGAVVNHNTLVDGTTANSLVKLSTPSQVT